MALRPHKNKVVSCQLTQANLSVIPVMIVSRDPGLFFCVLCLVLMYLWPAATNVVALRPHQTKRKPTAVPSWNSQPPRNIFAIYKTTAAKRSPWGLIQLWALFGIGLGHLFMVKNENANASDGTSCTAKASLTSMSCSRHFLQRPQCIECWTF